MKKKNKTSFAELIKVMARLRGPQGCPWDREQTHQSLLKYLKEETAEVIHAVKRKDFDNLHEELGDVLLQVLFHAQIAKEKGYFDIDDVVATLSQKLINRHPHVFSKKGKRQILTSGDVLKNWKKLKALDKEKRRSHRDR